MSEPTSIDEHHTSTFILRKIIGWSGVILLVVCFVYSAILTQPMLTSISAYYYTRAHGVFVGILCMLGVCFLSYTGPGNNPIERAVALISGTSALFVALCPTPPESKDATQIAELLIGPRYGFLGTVHIVSATVLFITFVVFSGVFFLRDTSSDAEDPLTLKHIFRSVIRPIFHVFIFRPCRATQGTPEKRTRNRVHFGCASAIAYSLVFIAVGKGVFRWDYAVIIGEIVAISAFALSWLTKAQHLFGDGGMWFGEKAMRQIRMGLRR